MIFVSFTQVLRKSLKVPAPSISSPGISLRFMGHACIPSKAGGTYSQQNNVSVKPEPGGSMALDEGQLVTRGALIVSGKESLVHPFAGSTIDFDASPSDPVSFQVTKNGYQYISGKGSVKLPSGKVYKFQ